jgi:hypothetical protein
VEDIMNLSEQILKLQQDTNMVTSNPLLDAINLGFIKQLESVATTDDGANRILARMFEIVRGLKIQDIEGHKRLYGKYGEAKLYVLLKAKQDVQINVLSAQTSHGGPDFRIEYEGRQFFAEVKSPVMLGGNLKYNRTMDDALDVKIDVEEQARQKGIGIGVQPI